MNAGEKKINHENMKKTSLKFKEKTSSKKTKPEISNSFFQRIISLLKKEELI
ncbi:hypothetical protein SAMN05443633_11395 [Chryseobacterium arachidis]|uniref:Uncharacterized protein n=2 Tax=Chryseobacterium arachidis TaxID=1416778 RepID=A0A1M5IYL0_9FLAO|nr:hypothetical protein SAMN05443633_11395 [Chryseobacterium arachidis]